MIGKWSKNQVAGLIWTYIYFFFLTKICLWIRIHSALIRTRNSAYYMTKRQKGDRLQETLVRLKAVASITCLYQRVNSDVGTMYELIRMWRVEHWRKKCCEKRFTRENILVTGFNRFFYGHYNISFLIQTKV